MTRTRVRPALLAAGGVLAALVLGVVLGEVKGWPFLRQPLQNALTRAAGVPVTLNGDFSTHLLWRPDAAVEQLRIGAAQDVPVPHLLDARQLRLAWRWGDIWRWRGGEPLRLVSVQAATLDAHFVRGHDGRASWQLGSRPADTAPETAPAPLDGLPRVALLQVEAGRIVVDDQPLRTQLRIELQGAREVESPLAGRPSGVAADAAPSGWQATVAGRWGDLPLQLQVRARSALPLLQDPEADAQDAPMVPVRVEGVAGAARLLFDGQAGALLGQRRLQGALRLRGPSLARVGEPLGITLPQTPPFDLTGELAHAAGVWQLRADRATIGRSVLNGNFRYETGRRPPRLSGQLGGARLALADLGPSVGTAGAAPAAAASGAGRRVLPRQHFDLPSLRTMDADVQVAVDELDFGSTAIVPLRSVQTHLLLQGGVLQLQEMKAQVAGGQFGGSSRLDANGDTARWSADLKFSAIDVAGWLPGVRTAQAPAAAAASASKAGLKQQRDGARQGGAQPVKAYLTGTLNGGLQATGRGRSTGEILSTLDGQAQVTLRDGTLSHLVTELAGLDVAQALGVLIRQDRPLPLRCARLVLVIHDGVVKPRVAVLDNADSTIRFDGQIDLGAETLALRAVTRPKDFSPLTLRTPVTVGGTLADPVVGVEGQRLAVKLLGALALGAAASPVAALLPLLDPGTRDPGDPCAEPAPEARAAAGGAPKR